MNTHLTKPEDERPTVACLCGSTRFMDAFFEVGWQLTIKGKIVLSVGVCKHAEDHGGEALGQDVADALDELHKRKIDLADEVWILNVDGYVGKSTRGELAYAKAHPDGKRIIWLYPKAIPEDLRCCGCQAIDVTLIESDDGGMRCAECHAEDAALEELIGKAHQAE